MWIDFLNDDLKQFTEKFKEDHLYDPDYLVIDENGFKEVHCMRCGLTIIQRETISEPCPSCGKVVELKTYSMRKLPNFRTIRKELNNGSYIDMIICDECLPKLVDATKEEHERIIAQINAGWINEMLHGKKDKKLIKQRIDSMKDIRIVTPEV